MFIAITLLVSAGCYSVYATSVDNVSFETISSSLSKLSTISNTILSVKSPEIKNPDWLQTQLDAEAAAGRAKLLASTGSVVTYVVETRGAIIADLSEFKTLANQTLNDSRGWSRLGVSFQEVSGGGSFTLVLSEANQVPSFNYNVCSNVWSCQVGRYVIINQDRWLSASDAWTAGGGSLRDYRNMVVSHETGHWLGHPHLYTCGVGGLAPVMMQQSIDLRGCSFNPWPLDGELWSSTLGIG